VRGRPFGTAGLVLAIVSFGALPSLNGQGLEVATTALRAGSYDDAISEFSRLTARDRSSAGAARGLVSALREVGRYDDALRAARRYRQDNPGSSELDNALGEVLYATGRIEEAEQAFLRALTASDSLVARFNRAVLKYERGDVDEAMSDFDDFIDVYNRGGALSSEELTAVAAAVRYLGVRNPVLFRDALRAYDEAVAADRDNLEPRIQLGEMFLEKYNGTDADATFTEVLTLNPHSPRALLGLARTRRFNGEPEAMSLAERSLETNPNLVAARVFTATLYLELEHYGRAEAEIDRALEVNPSSLEALAVRAASRYLQGDQRVHRETIDRALGLNPRFGGLYVTLAEVSARNRLYRQAAEFARQAVQLDDRSWRGFALLGINQLRNGAIDAGRDSLELAFEGDPYDVWTKNTLDLLDTLQQYPVTRDDRFEFVIDGKESELLSIYFSDVADEAYANLAEGYGHSAATPIRVEVFPDHADFSVRTVGLVGLGALGVSFGPVVAMDSPSARDIGDFNWGSTLWHELAHTFHLEMSAHRVPRWFTEGLAVFEERRADRGWGQRVSPGFLMAYRDGRLLSVDELNDGFMRPSYPGQLGHAYYQASLICEIIERDHGHQALVEMLRGYARGRSTQQLVKSVLGVETDELDERLEDLLEEKYAGVLSALPSGESAESEEYHSREQVVQRAAANPGDFLAQLGMGRSLFEEGDAEGAVPYLERAKALFPDYAEGDSPYWYLARVHRQRGDLERAVAELSVMVQLNERHYQARLELADIQLALNNESGAARALEDALFIYPFEADVHSRLAEIHAETGNRQGAIRERRATVALDPVDRAEALYQLAKAYLEAGQLDQARHSVLSALEDAPSFEKAQELLLEIHARRGGGGR
jgi:tetratricopeptide (TPR) repeat protein